MELGRLSIQITNYKDTCMHVRAFEALVFLRTLDERHDHKTETNTMSVLIRAGSIA